MAKKYLVKGKLTLDVRIVVDAEDVEDAKEWAYDEFPFTHDICEINELLASYFCQDNVAWVDDEHWRINFDHAEEIIEEEPAVPVIYSVKGKRGIYAVKATSPAEAITTVRRKFEVVDGPFESVIEEPDDIKEKRLKLNVKLWNASGVE